MELREWKYINGSQAQASKSSAGSYKKRFEKLIKYHIDHASSELERIVRKDIRDTYFHLGEHYNDGKEEFDRDIVVSYDKNSDTFFLRIFIDGKQVDDILRKGYEAFVKAIEAYMYLPDSGTEEYDDLLVEWVAMKNTSTGSSSPTSGSSQASKKTSRERFKELTDYMIAHVNSFKHKKVSKAEVVRLDDSGFTYKERASMNGEDFILTLLVYGNKYNPSSTAWKYELYIDTELIKEDKGTSMKELLKGLSGNFKVPKIGEPEYDSICESVSSMADDFKLYENLWD